MIQEHEKLKRLQKIQYNILKLTDELCIKYDIKYHLVYGTLLGAVRHQATIPWDNDIDIAMEREEFYKFRKIFKKNVKDLELRDICYSSIEYASLSRIIKAKDEEFGNVHIDIFILDNAKKYPVILRKFVGYIARFLQIAKLSRNEKDILYSHFKHSNGKKVIVWLGDILCGIFSNARIEKWNYKLLVSKHNENNMIIIEDPDKLIKKKGISETIYWRYEDKEYPIFKYYDEILKMWYGNYMEIPKEGKEYYEKEGEMILLNE